MASVANPARPKTHNAYMTASGWGTIYCRIVSIDHGMTMTTSESTARFGRYLYLTRRTSGSFVAQFVFTSRKEYSDFGAWIEQYGLRLAQSSPSVGPVRVVCPSKNFDKIAIPGGADFGDSVEMNHYSSTISFTGSSNPISLTSNKLSSFSLPRGGDSRLPYYYPGGTQLSGSDAPAEEIFNKPPPYQGSGIYGPGSSTPPPGLGKQPLQ